MLFRILGRHTRRNCARGATHNNSALTRAMAWSSVHGPTREGASKLNLHKETAVMIVELGTATKVTQGSLRTIPDVGKPGHQAP